MNKAVSQQSVTFNRPQQKQILKRFLQITLGRLARVRLDLSQEQQMFLDILPVLLHSNHRQFPCFVSESTPAGVCRYQPSGAEIQKLQRLLPDYSPEPQAENPRAQIMGIYFSGDCGTIIRSAEQNIRVWVCHGQNLGANDIAQLERKCRLIENWARSMQLVTHFHVVDPTFLSADRQQDFLELDHLYRSGILIAGRMPLWWLIPPEQESNYKQFASILFHKRFITNEEVIDFGGIPNIPADQFVRVSLGQLELGLDCPYSAMISLILTEIYLTHYPNTEILSAIFKQSVYNDDLDLDALDPHVMVYRTCEKYLEDSQQTERLALLRRCFYLKVDIPLSIYDKSSSWQRKVLESLTQAWGWDKEHLRELDQYGQLDIKNRVADYQALGRELIHGYRTIRDFASKTDIDDALSEQIYRLGFLVNSRFERRAGKVDQMRLMSDTQAQPLLCFGHTRQNHKSLWSVYNEAVNFRDIPNKQPLKRGQSLVELLTYCHLNGLIDDATELQLIAGTNASDTSELERLSEQTSAFIERVSASNEQALDHSRHTQVFLRAHIDPTATAINQRLEGKGLKPVYLQEQLDSIEILCVNRVGEYLLRVFDGNQRLPDALCFLLANGEQQSFRISATEGHEALEQTFGSLMQQLQACFFHDNETQNARFFAGHPGGFICIARDQHQYQYQLLQGQTGLISAMQQVAERYSPIVCEQTPLIPAILREVSATIKADCIQLYYHRINADCARLYISDNQGSLFVYEYDLVDPLVLFNLFRQFIEHSVFELADQPIPSIRCYQIDQVDKKTPFTITEVDLQYTNLSHWLTLTVHGENPLGRKPRLGFEFEQHVYQGDEAMVPLGKHLVTRHKEGNAVSFISSILTSGKQADTNLNLTQRLALKAEWEQLLRQRVKTPQASASA